MRLWILFTVICNWPFASLCCPFVGLCRLLTRFECCLDYNWQFACDRTARTGGIELETGACYYDWFCCVSRLKTASTVSHFKRLYCMRTCRHLAKTRLHLQRKPQCHDSLRTSNLSMYMMFAYKRSYVIAYFAPYVNRQVILFRRQVFV
jgi:hypothetical protein